VRGAVFLASEGIVSSNVSQGYILRRLLRRAIRYGKLLGLKSGFLVSLADLIIEKYKVVYPEVLEKREEIIKVIEEEEKKFEKTLQSGLAVMEKMLVSKSDKEIKGEEAFDLYQSYGFPLELIEEIAQEKGFSVDKKGFELALVRHQEISRAGAEKSLEEWASKEEKKKPNFILPLIYCIAP